MSLCKSCLSDMFCNILDMACGKTRLRISGRADIVRHVSSFKTCMITTNIIHKVKSKPIAIGIQGGLKKT